MCQRQGTTAGESPGQSIGTDSISSWLLSFFYSTESAQDTWFLEYILQWSTILKIAHWSQGILNSARTTVVGYAHNIDASLLYGIVALTVILVTCIVLYKLYQRSRRKNANFLNNGGVKYRSDSSEKTPNKHKYDFVSATNSPRRKYSRQTKTAKVPPFSPHTPVHKPQSDYHREPMVQGRNPSRLSWSARGFGPHWSVQRVFIILGICAFVISIPWEFIRLYQQEVAKKAAKAINSIPSECVPDQMPIWRWALNLIFSPFKWENPECESYHIAMLTDPLWEVTPVVVFCSLLSRCVLTPLDSLCRGVGEGLRLLLYKVPWQWQPIVMVLVTVVVLVIVAMLLRYRIVLPFILRLEPGRRTPVIARVRPMRSNEASIDGDTDSDHTLSICQ